MFRFSGKKVMFLGDLHFDDTYQGRHVNYWDNIVETVERITAKVEDEKPDMVILAGDLFGVPRGTATIRNRMALQYVTHFLQSLPNLYIVKGNHDYAEQSDYEFLSSIGIFNSSKQADYMLEFTHPLADKPSYIHLIDYGLEDRNIDVRDDHYNIAVTHNDFYVKGKEQAYVSDSSIDLSSKQNFFGMDLVMNGHLHMPSQQFTEFNFSNGHDSAFINLGCPTRPSHGELYDYVWYTILEFVAEKPSDVHTLSMRTETMKLKPYHEVFRYDVDYLEDMEDENSEDDMPVSKEDLTKILSTLVTTNMGSEDFIAQIDRVSIVSQEARDIAKEYMLRAENL